MSMKGARNTQGAETVLWCGMNAILKTLVETAEHWSEEDQHALLAYAQEIEARREGVYHVTDDERRAIQEGLAQIKSGNVYSEEEVYGDLPR